MKLPFLQPSNFEMFIKLIETLIWPITLLIIILLFRKNFQNVFNRLGSIKADTTGIAITFDKELEATKKLFEKIKPKVTSKSGVGIKTQVNREGTPYNQVMNVRNDLVDYLISKSETAGLKVDVQFPNQMSTQLLAHNSIATEKAQMINALLHLTEKADINTSQAQADVIHKLFNQINL